jgi:hypothetical protein
MTPTSIVLKQDPWPLYRRPQNKFMLPSKEITHLSFPRAIGSNESDIIIPIPDNHDLNQAIFTHYDGYAVDREKYGNFCGEHIATRRHEILDCDPYVEGLVVVGNTAYLIVYDARFQRSWCLAPGFEAGVE